MEKIVILKELVYLKWGIFLFFLPLLFASCSNTKYLAQDENLLVKSKLDLKGELSSTEKEDIRNGLNSSSVTMQKPNTLFLGIFRSRLWLYNKKHNDHKTGKIWNWLLIDKNMEPPVIFDTAKANKTVGNMLGYLNNQGYFYAEADYQEKTKRRRTNVTYHVNTGKAFQIDSINYEIPDTTILNAVKTSADKSFLKKGDPFKAGTAIKERNRIAEVIQNEGYFGFSEQNIRFVVDTINKSIFRDLLDPFSSFQGVEETTKEEKEPRLDLTIQILNPTDTTSFPQYYVHDLFVYPDYSAFSTPDSALFEQTDYEGLKIRFKEDIVRPQALKEAILMKKGELYSQEEHTSTLQKLNGMGVWRFVNIQVDTLAGASDSLDFFIFLTPGKRQELGANIEATTSGDDYIIGGALNLTYQNNNTNRSANRLRINLKGGLEWNSDSSRSFFVQAREFSGGANYTIPRFLLPFNINLKNREKYIDQQTNLGVGVNYLKRFKFFSLSNINASLGYSWSSSEKKKWIVNPISLTYNKISSISPAFKQQLENNPFLKNSFSSVFIEGESGSFIYTDQTSEFQPQVNLVRINLEESGLLLNGIDGAIRGVSGGKTSFAKLAKVDYSQFVRADLEYKHYFNRRHSALILRTYGGIGIPYGKSTVLPYIRQFTAGGPNSMRAWRLRSLGPGSYLSPDLNNPNIFPDQTGEMKLEGNAEYRFDIVKFFNGFMKLKGALFVDAGNIWNLRKDPNRPGAEFQLNRLYQDVAVGSGFGFRLDFSYAVLRLDMATPMKRPYIDKNYGWKVERPKLFDGDWRRKNLIFNFAVGYPF